MPWPANHGKPCFKRPDKYLIQSFSYKNKLFNKKLEAEIGKEIRTN